MTMMLAMFLVMVVYAVCWYLTDEIIPIGDPAWKKALYFSICPLFIAGLILAAIVLLAFEPLPKRTEDSNQDQDASGGCRE